MNHFELLQVDVLYSSIINSNTDNSETIAMGPLVSSFTCISNTVSLIQIAKQTWDYSKLRNRLQSNYVPHFHVIRHNRYSDRLFHFPVSIYADGSLSHAGMTTVSSAAASSFSLQVELCIQSLLPLQLQAVHTRIWQPARTERLTHKGVGHCANDSMLAAQRHGVKQRADRICAFLKDIDGLK